MDLVREPLSEFVLVFCAAPAAFSLFGRLEFERDSSDPLNGFDAGSRILGAFLDCGFLHDVIDLSSESKFDFRIPHRLRPPHVANCPSHCRRETQHNHIAQKKTPDETLSVMASKSSTDRRYSTDLNANAALALCQDFHVEPFGTTRIVLF